MDESLLQHSGETPPSRCDCGASYAEAIGYCRCVAAPLACDPSFDFRGALLTDLASKEGKLPPQEHLRFQFARDVRDNPVLKAVATRAVMETHGGGADIGKGAQGTAREGNGVTAARSNGATRGALDGRAPEVREGQGRARTHGMSEAVLRARVLKIMRTVMFSLQREGAVHFLDKAEDVYVLLSRARVLAPRVVAVCRERHLSLGEEDGIIRALQGTALFHFVPGSRIRSCISYLKSRAPEMSGQYPERVCVP